MNNKATVPVLATDGLQLIRSRLRDLWSDGRGQGMTEYVIVLVAIAVVCIAITVEFGGTIKGHFETASESLGELDAAN